MTEQSKEQLKATVKQQFGAHAAQYVISPTHAQGADLELLPRLAGLTGQERVLDIATATGHTAFALAPHAREVIGVDLTPEMLTEARQQAAAKALTNVTFQEADAESLPFPDGAFDLVTCRIAAHHFPAVAAFCQEAARVLRPGGKLIVIDNVAPADPTLDQFINAIEKRRDPSHFRAHSLAEWQGYCEAAGLTYQLVQQYPVRLNLASWLDRMAVPADVQAEIRQRLAEASPEAKAQFVLTPESFDLLRAIIVGTKA